MILSLLWACGPKEPVQVAPKVGWQQEIGWSLACYYPEEFEKLTELDKRMAWQKSMESIFSQWNGQRGDGVSMDEGVLDQIDLQLSSKPQKVEKVVRENLAMCEKVAVGQASIADWKTWVNTLPASLSAGECYTHFHDTVLDYLNITTAFENSFGICGGDIIRISGTSKDQYRINNDASWINVEGDKNAPSLGSELPCNIEGCYNGMLILRFTDTDGRVTVHPVGVEFEFKAPRDGHISYGINDDSFYDNAWYQTGSLKDHAAVTIMPVDK